MKKRPGNKKIMYIAGAIFLLVALLIGGLFFSSSKKIFFVEKKSQQKIVGYNCSYHSSVNGVCVDVSETVPALVTVMIENHPDARPQAGLGQASVVYEALVEGSYTRFLALFKADQKVEKVGPVRSARSYYLDWVREWGNPLYMHVGGSPEALQKIAAGGIFDANEFYHGASYWRDKSKRAPHNVYTNSDRWNKLWQTMAAQFEAWQFTTTSVSCQANCVNKIHIPYSNDSDVRWEYNTSTTRYTRFHGGAKHVTEEGEIMAETIVVQEVTVKVIDAEGRLSLQTIGQGKAVVLYDGKKMVGTWEKESRSERTYFYDQNGIVIPLKPGKIWVEIVPRLDLVKFNQL